MNKKIFYILIILVLIYIIYKFKPNNKTTMETENNDNTKLKFNGNKDNYIALMKPFALQLEKEYKIPYKFILAQTGLETGWGKSSLVNDAYNFGGIKAVKSQDYVTRYTYEVVSNPNEYFTRDKSKDKKVGTKTQIYLPQKFARYPNVWEGLKSYAKVLMLPRYKEAFKYTDPKKFAEQIAKGGYATSPTYYKTISSLIDTIK